MSPPAAPKAPNWLALGQAHEKRGRATDLENALCCYDRAIAQIPHPLADPHRYHLAVIWMNRGNAAQKRSVPTAFGDALLAYDRAIELLTKSPLPLAPTARATLGALWMNRGAVLLLSGDRAKEAVHSFDQAITVFQSQPLEQDCLQRRHLAAAWTNRASSLLSNDPAAAHASAIQALAFLAPLDTIDPNAADLTLQARRIICASLLSTEVNSDGSLPPLWRTRLSDELDASLRLVHHWLAAPSPQLLTTAFASLRFGTAFYQRHWPQFLPEFLLETAQSFRTTQAQVDRASFDILAREALHAAWHQAQDERLFAVDSASSDEAAARVERLQIALASFEG